MAGDYPLVLNNDIVLTEGAGYILVGLEDNETLTIDLNGHTIQGTSSTYATIDNIGGTLTITDTSLLKSGKVLNSPANAAVAVHGGLTTLNAGEYGEIDDLNIGQGVLVIEGGKYYDPLYTPAAPSFYLQGYLATGSEVVDWNQVGELWYATVSSSVVIPCDVTFSTNNVVVAEWSQVVNSGDALTAAKIPDVSGLTGSWDAPAPTAESVITSDTNFNFTVAAPVVTYAVTFSTNSVAVAEYTTNITAGATLPDGAIPAFTGGAWDVDPTNAVINAATNFNYTIVASYTLTYASDHGAIPDGETYTASTPDFALAAAPTAEGWTFGGWLIGSDVFEAGDTYVVANHLENTTATAVWTPTAYTLTYVTDKGTAPDAVSYTVESNNFALAAAPDPGVVGVAFAGWVIGSVTNEAGATYVVADHLENTTATAAWVALAPPKKFPQSDTAGTEYAGRDGTPASPFVIRNYDDLVLLKNAVADGEITTESFEVVSNITGVTAWVGIGTSSAKFAGTLNGNGKTIAITFADAVNYNGLFAYVENATLSNLTVNVTAADSISGETSGAAFVGKAYGSCTFETLKATGVLGTSVNRVNHNAAGICVGVYGNGGVMNFNSCTNEMDIYASYKKVAGILAFRDSYATTAVSFNNCVNTGDIDNSYASTAACNGTAGMIGWTAYGAANITINGCSNTGTMVSANNYSGNFVGYRDSTPTVSGVNTGLASLKPAGYADIPGLNWATVDGDLATFVTPVASVDSVVAYKVMQANSSPNFTLADPDASLTIDSSLAAYSGTVSVDSTLSADYDLRETAILNGTIYSLESKTPADPWAPAEQTDEAASNKVVEIFGEDSDVANHVNTLAEYGALVAYITNVTSEATVPSDLTGAQKSWMWKSFILGANPLFDADVAVEITSLTANSEAGKWDFTVKVTEGESTDAYNVAADKVAALVKIRTSLTTGTWVTPTAGNIEAIKLLGGNLIKVTVNFGDGASGFMKVAE